LIQTFFSFQVFAKAINGNDYNEEYGSARHYIKTLYNLNRNETIANLKYVTTEWIDHSTLCSTCNSNIFCKIEECIIKTKQYINNTGDCVSITMTNFMNKIN